jgi:uncharacterized repeat protein (TIGR01451 family)
VPLPTGIVYVSGPAACGPVVGGFTCSVTPSSFPAGQEDSYSVTLRAKSSAAASPPAYSLTGTVASLGTIDPTPGNNTSTASFTVITRADLSLTTAAITYPSGQTAAFANTDSTKNFAIYEYDVTNNGPSDAQSVSFGDTLPSGVTFVGACFGASSCTPNQTLPLSIGTLNGNDGPPTHESTHIRVKVTANSSLTGGPLSKADSASVTSATTDPGPSLNARSESATVWTVPSNPTNPDGQPGNQNAYFLWQQSLTANGGSPIDYFEVTVAGPTTPTVPHVNVTDSCGTNGNNNDNSMIFCTQITPLNNPPATSPYTFTVKAHNVVGFSSAVTSGPVVPSVDASAQQIKTGNLSQQTGNTANPTAGDPIITTQTFNSGTAGIGLLQERAARGNSFCGGKCIGGTVLVNKLKDPNAPTGFYQVNILYYKTLVNGTGIKVAVYFAPNDTASLGTQLPLCPAKISNITTDCFISKLGNQGANPALRIIVYTNKVDPTVGARGIPK